MRNERKPGSPRVLLMNPGWESRPMRYLELSGVERVVEGRAAPRLETGRLDNVETEERAAEGF